MTNLVLNGESLSISEQRVKYNEVRLKYHKLAEHAATRFSADFANNFKNIDDVHNKCPDIALSVLQQTADVAVKDLVSLGVYDIDLDAFEEYLEPYFSWNEDFGVIDDKYMSIVLKAEELDNYRTERRQARGRWVGGGFGFSGAIKGAAQAGAMNLATGAVHGLFNLTAKTASMIGDAVKKNALYTDHATKDTLVSALYRAVFNVHFAFIDAANANKPNTYSGYVLENEQVKASRLIQNIEAGRVPEAAVKQVLLDAFASDPYNEGFYRAWLKVFGDSSGELDKLESYFGLSVSARTKRDLIRARRATMNFSTPKACDKGSASLKTYASSLGVENIDEELEVIANIKAALEQKKEDDEVAAVVKEVESRTVKGVIYPTHAQAEEARQQRHIGTGFYIGLAFFPYVVALLTLRKGYTKQTRIIAFAYLAFAVLVTVFTKS